MPLPVGPDIRVEFVVGKGGSVREAGVPVTLLNNVLGNPVSVEIRVKALLDIVSVPMRVEFAVGNGGRMAERDELTAIPPVPDIAVESGILEVLMSVGPSTRVKFPVGKGDARVLEALADV